MVRGEEKQFEGTVDHLIDYAKNIRISLLRFIQRIETEGDNMDWPQVLDSFVSICGQINTLMRFTRDNKSLYIENRVVLPLLLSPDRDEELAKLTEGRVQVVNHDMVPDYLRTKPDPEIEDFEKILQLKSNSISPDAACKMINAMTKLVKHTTDTIRANMSRADSEMMRQTIRPSFSNNDTNEIIIAITSGRGLRGGPSLHRAMQMSNDSLLSQRNQEQATQQQIVQKQNVKAPELKTNIKAGP